MDADDADRDMEDSGSMAASKAGHLEERGRPKRQKGSLAADGGHGTAGGAAREGSDSDDDVDSGTGGAGAVAGGGALAGLMAAYTSPRVERNPKKRVKWPDLETVKEKGKGFTIGDPAKKALRLIIGPGAGYSHHTNSVTMEGRPFSALSSTESHQKFLLQQSSEQAEFRAVLSRRRQRIGLDED